MARSSLCSIAALVALMSAPAMAGDRATPDDAKAMAAKAGAYLQQVGAEKAFAAFDAKDGPWHDRDLYVTVLDLQGVVVAHGTDAALIGHNVIDLKDVDGEPFIRDMIAVTQSGWVEYKWRNPMTKAVEAKASYEMRVGQYVVGVGAYKAH